MFQVQESRTFWSWPSRHAAKSVDAVTKNAKVEHAFLGEVTIYNIYKGDDDYFGDIGD